MYDHLCIIFDEIVAIVVVVVVVVQTIGEGPAAPGVGKTTVEFINSAPCPVSIDRESFFRVNLKYGEVIIMRLCFILALGEKNIDDVSYRKLFVSIIDK